jgi:hypothetical protein
MQLFILHWHTICTCTGEIGADAECGRVYSRLHVSSALLTDEDYPDGWPNAMNKFLPMDMDEHSEMRCYWMQDPCGPDGKPRSTEDLEDLHRKSIEQEHTDLFAVDWELSKSLTHPHEGKDPAELPAPITDDVKGCIQSTVVAVFKGDLTMGRIFARRFGGTVQNVVEYMLSPRMRSDGAKKAAGTKCPPDKRDETRLNAFGDQVRTLAKIPKVYTDTMLRPSDAEMETWRAVEGAILANVELYQRRAKDKVGPAYAQDVYCDILAVSNAMTWECMPPTFSAMLEEKWGHDELFQVPNTDDAERASKRKTGGISLYIW